MSRAVLIAIVAGLWSVMAQVKVEAQKIYWSQSAPEELRRVNVYGTEGEAILKEVIYNPGSFAFDSSRGKVYWRYWGYPDSDRIQRANFDGTGPEVVIEMDDHEEHVTSVDFDSINSMIVWTQVRSQWPGLETSRIRRAHLDGSGIEDIIFQESIYLQNILVDPNLEKMYWSEYENNRVRRADLDGGRAEDILEVPSSIRKIAVDSIHEKLYVLGGGWIWRSNLDGSNVETLSIPTSIYRFAVEPLSETIFWFNVASDAIERADLNAQHIEVILPTGDEWITALAVHSPSGKLYWGIGPRHAIYRANLDGASIEEILTSTPLEPGPIAVDANSGRLFWAEYRSGGFDLKLAGMDGGDAATAFSTASGSIGAMALDLGVGSVYWTAPVEGKIRRVDLANARIEDVVPSGLNRPTGLALDTPETKMYWTEASQDTHDRIQRANLDGSDKEVLVSNSLHNPSSVAVDPDAGKIYWTSPGPISTGGFIYRANVDGSAGERVVASTSIEGLAWIMSRVRSIGLIIIG